MNQDDVMQQPMATPSASPTLADTQAALYETLGKGDEATCPCCMQDLKPEKKSLTSRQAATLFLIYQAFPVGSCVDVDVFVNQFTADFGKTLAKGRGCHPLTYWGLLAPIEFNERMQLAHQAAFPEGKKSPNVYQLTQQGAEFIFNNLGLPKQAVILNGRVVSWSSDKFTTCIELIKKRHEELLATEVPRVGQFL